ncbi:hypothetical protein V8E53_009070 [Lactarius tabidus]
MSLVWPDGAFVLTTGLSSLGEPKFVAGGIAELIAGAISMGVGVFLYRVHLLDNFVTGGTDEGKFRPVFIFETVSPDAR